jgi:hypothetical protein
MIEPEGRRMDLLWEVFVWSLTNHEMTPRRENSPKLFNIWIPWLRDMFKNTICKNEHKLSVREWKSCRIGSVDKGNNRSGNRISHQPASLFNPREDGLHADYSPAPRRMRAIKEVPQEAPKSSARHPANRSFQAERVSSRVSYLQRSISDGSSGSIGSETVWCGGMCILSSLLVANKLSRQHGNNRSQSSI